MLMDWVKCLMEMEIANLQRTEFKDTLKFIMKKKKKIMAGPFGQNFIAATHNSIQ